MTTSQSMCRRHIVKYIMGMTDEDHLSAAVWNLLCIIHHEELGQTELDDMPHYLSKDISNTPSDRAIAAKLHKCIIGGSFVSRVSP